MTVDATAATEVDASADVGRFLLGDAFPCLAGRSAWRQGGIVHRHYTWFGDDETARQMAADLQAYVEAVDWAAKPFTSFVATFSGPLNVSEVEFESLLWQQLQAVHDYDSLTYPWAEGYDHDPSSGAFAYSVAGHPFFVIGLHETHSRIGRRPPFPMLAFNSHAQFDRIKAAGLWDRLQEKIRKQDIELQGNINPNLVEYEQLSEARRYSGRRKPADWACPFSARV
ncbi:guanitoxin biosynthesis heme-dependent pre-guanitoxin N-hydroxylase GntA [Streptomyces sp. DSM 41527]|uniref:Guanitoxin biosynthesis heme-dependent pre-guanitoxin N-hydroxylase GntA n=1 Tax=Streptomyces mooreae TaxID=3075523 RepID=A0ABU2T7U8_9ACTN|nr:guanitoxin biosynthesis heme-dependent pre-guanitoxin N-hydroxylase GntA [Streptomyces sp. DSM 41527]MDT0456374.1 guanitoxin biosynthesis heme-dependent pre-guanitoxin N-hydroxylase GntA [Streptomyces sp. DSM 41527]